jgi:hypothetical protein
MDHDLVELQLSVGRLQEQIVQMNVLLTYLYDKSKLDINGVCTMLFTVSKNKQILLEMLPNPEDRIVLERIIDKWERSVTITEESRITFN